MMISPTISHPAELKAPPDVVVTGIPRSGTSFLIASFNKIENCVGINEPEEIFRYLDETEAPWGMHLYYETLRNSVLNGEPLVNKFSDGIFIEDTAAIDEEQHCLHAVSGTGFLLATKNTLGYLARLPYLLHAIPHATFVACVRHPFSVIASWKETFVHLRDADPRQFRKGFLGDRLMSDQARERLAILAEAPDVETRRALLWRHLAMLISESREIFTRIFRYEDFVRDPESHFRSLLAGIPNAPDFSARAPFARSTPRTSRLSALTAEETEIIRRVCAEAAEPFGYNLNECPATAP
jgi:hypothetical protein